MESKTGSWLVINRKSGSYSPGLEDRIASGLHDAGHPVARVDDCTQVEIPGRADLETAGTSLLVVHGGDGTFNSVATRLSGWGGTVLPLPGGTANLLCNRLFETCDVETILRRLHDRELAVRQVDCVRSDDWTAVSEALAGPGARWADVREDLRENDIQGIVSDSAEAIRSSIDGPRVRVFDADRRVGREDGYAGLRLSPGDGHVRIEGYRIERLSEFLETGAAILSHDFRTGPHDNLEPLGSGSIRSTGDEPIELMIDGERREGAAQETFRLEPLGLNLLGSPA